MKVESGIEQERGGGEVEVEMEGGGEREKKGGLREKGLHSGINEMKEREREKGEKWGSSESEREVERLKEKKRGV